jgi:uncharacterized protein YjlB
MNSETFILHPSGWIPGNERFPVMIYRGVLKAEGKKAAEAFEKMFADHGWPPRWRDTVFDYHHYHSITHEALGVFAGFATLALGGPSGRLVEVRAGDALILPAGTGHCRIEGSSDFEVVGAYPEGCDWDICTEAPDEKIRARLKQLPAPERNPVTGAMPAFG